MPADLFISWADYHRQIEILIARIHASGWAFDHIVCVARGGMRAGDLVSRAFRKPLSIVAAKQAVVSPQTASLEEVRGRVLLIDDVAVSGATLAAVKEALLARHAAIAELRTAVVWRQGTCAAAPDYCAASLEHSPRIHPPYELYDFASLEAQAARVRLNDE